MTGEQAAAPQRSESPGDRRAGGRRGHSPAASRTGGRGDPSAGPRLGERVEVEVGPVAHGGHCVARHEGRVLFVRHALPGERVVARITGSGGGGRYLRADAVEVLRANPGRRSAPCPVAASCGGCDWQHATPAAARDLKAQVIRESLRRFAGIEVDPGFEVRAVLSARPPDTGPPDTGLGWRTRGRLSVDPRGRAGFRAARSHEVVAVDDCLQLHPRLGALRLFESSWPPGERVGFVAPAIGAPLAFPDGSHPPGTVTEQAAGRDWAVAPDGFWQVHPGAADALVGVVRDMLDPRPGQRLVDLYAGVGLFGVSLAAQVPLAVTLVEADRRACELARLNAGSLPVTIVRAGVARWVARGGNAGGAGLRGMDLVVLDPPRTGAGAGVVEAIVSARPRAVAYVACDPVALARDLATFGSAGFGVRRVVALDLFPTTHHVETVALVEPSET